MPAFTKTTWNVTDASHTFRAERPGKCALTGTEFYAGAPLKRVLVDGVARYWLAVSRWSITSSSEGVWNSPFCFDLGKLPEVLEMPGVKVIHLHHQDGRDRGVAYQRKADGSFYKGAYGSCTAKQFWAQARKSFAFIAADR